MTWTREKPVKAGWYWWKRGAFEPEMVRVLFGDLLDLGPKKRAFYMIGFRDHEEEGIQITFQFRLETCGGHWSSEALVPPTEAG